MPQLTIWIILNDETNAAVLLISPCTGSTASPCGRSEEWHRDYYSQLCRLDVFGRALDGVAVLCGKLGDELEQGGTLVLHRFPVAAEQGLVLCCQDVDPCLQLRETVSNVMHQ